MIETDIDKRRDAAEKEGRNRDVEIRRAFRGQSRFSLGARSVRYVTHVNSPHPRGYSTE